MSNDFSRVDIYDLYLSPICQQAVADRIASNARENENIVRSLLSRWVSEVEPAVAWQKGKIIGLVPANSPVGSRPFMLAVD